MCGYPRRSASGGGNSQRKGPGVGTDCGRKAGRSVQGEQRVLDRRVVGGEGSWRSGVWPWKPRQGLGLFVPGETEPLSLALSRDLPFNRILWLLRGDQAEGIKSGGREALGRLQL